MAILTYTYGDYNQIPPICQGERASHFRGVQRRDPCLISMLSIRGARKRMPGKLNLYTIIERISMSISIKQVSSSEQLNLCQQMQIPIFHQELNLLGMKIPDDYDR